MSIASISIVTPNYNYAETLEATIQSVLQPGVPGLEYVVIDDASTDRSPEILRKYEGRLRWERLERNGGQYPAIMHGFDRTSGTIMGWINSDDVFYPWTLRTVVEIFNQFPEVDWIMGLPAKVQDGAVHEVAPLRAWPQGWLRLGLYSGGRFGVVQQESCFWRRRLWEKVGGLDLSLRLAADFELWTRFARHAELHACSTLLGGFSITGRNRSLIQNPAYLAEVETVIGRLSKEDKRERNWILEGFRRFDFVARVPLVRRMMAAQLGSAEGPVVVRNFAANEFRVERRVFPIG
ncbi:MAG: glycosyltransferase family 2 protein [Verrucomicrobiia bacterium]